MSIFEKNLESLEEKYPLLVEELRGINIDEDGQFIQIVTDSQGTEVISLQREGRRWYLNSRLDAQTVAQIYADGCEVKDYGVYFLFGFADGLHINALLSKCNNTNKLIVCIPDIYVFYKACEIYDLAKIITDDRVILLYLEKITMDLQNSLRNVINYLNNDLVNFFIMPCQDLLYPELCRGFIDCIGDVLQDIVVMKSTNLTFNRKIPQNRMTHMKNMLNHSNIKQLKDAFSKEDIEAIPVIIVSAGPSLDKNVHLLEQAKGKAFIIVVDAALRAMNRVGVQPDMICTIDPKVPDRFYEGVNLDRAMWACGGNARPDIVCANGKRVFYYSHFSDYWNEKLENVLEYEFPSLESGGSVSIEAFSLARYLGFKRIILIGQDLAFTGGVSHTKGIGDVLGGNDAYIKSRKIVQVEGVDGELLDTDFQMWYYKQWFEKFIDKYQDELEVIDATEGGALIKGAKLQPLEECIRQYCTKEIPLYDIELAVPYAFDEKQKEEMLSYLVDLKDVAKKFRDKVKEIIEEQKKLLWRVDTKKKLDDNTIRDLNKISEQSEWVKNSPIIDLICSYASEAQYAFGDVIYKQEDMSISDIVRQSIDLLKGYLEAGENLLEDMEEYLN